MKDMLRGALMGIPVLLWGSMGCSSTEPGQIIHPDGSGTAGSASSAGSTGSAGSSAAGTSGGAAGQTGDAGSSGAGTTGAAGSAGGTTGAAGTTGTAGTGGSGGAAGTMGAAGTGSQGGTNGNASICTPMGNQFDCNNVLSGMDGYLNKDDANGPSQGSDAIQFNCTTSDTVGKQVIYKQKHWQLTGPGITTGKTYKVGMHFYGIMECKTYVGGTGPAKTDPNETPNVSQSHNLWLAGSRDNGDHWNTYAFTITPMSLSTLVGIGPQDVMLPDVASTYVINQCPGNRAEGHFTFNVDFESSINVPGGSFINYIEYDTNCRMIANCGAADASQSCNGPYNIVDTVKSAVPNTNATFTQPIANTANPPSRGQWWLVDVTSVTAM
jgi:hypothetical protein